MFACYIWEGNRRQVPCRGGKATHLATRSQAHGHGGIRLVFCTEILTRWGQPPAAGVAPQYQGPRSRSLPPPLRGVDCLDICGVCLTPHAALSAQTAANTARVTQNGCDRAARPDSEFSAAARLDRGQSARLQPPCRCTAVRRAAPRRGRPAAPRARHGASACARLC